MTRYFVGIDVGTTATKAVLMAEGAVLNRVRSPHQAHTPASPGRVDPFSWWTSVQDACRALGAGGITLSGIGLSIHCPVAVPMNAAGVALSDGYRFEAPGLPEIVRSITAGLTPEERRLIGNRISPATFIAAAYLLIEEREPDVARNVHTLGSVGTYIGHRLTQRLAIDPTQASYFGPFDTTESWSWQNDLAARLGIPPRTLPPVLPSTATLGTLSAEAADALRLTAGAPVIVGAGDTACAAYAAGLDRTGDRLFTLGTTHVITDHTNHPNPNDRHLQRAAVNPGQWLRHGVTNGGLALAVGARMLGYGRGSDAVPRMVTEAYSADPEDIARAPIFIPHVRSERGPLWLDTPRSALLGLTAETDEAGAAWSVVEGVLFANRLVWESYEHEDTTEALLLAGDFRGDDRFVQLAADLLAASIKLSNESHLPAVGAAQLAAGADIRNPSPAHQTVMKPRSELSAVIAKRWPRFVAARERYLAETPAPEI